MNLCYNDFMVTDPYLNSMTSDRIPKKTLGFNSKKILNARRETLLLSLLPDGAVVGLLHEESPLHELEDLVDEDDWCAPPQHNLPLAPAERYDAEHVLQDRGVEEGEVESHGKGDGVDEDHVLPERQGEERLG